MILESLYEKLKEIEQNQSSSNQIIKSFDDLKSTCLPISFCIEASTLIENGRQIYEQIEQTIQQFLKQASEDDEIGLTLAVHIVAFHETATEILPFTEAYNIEQMPTIEALPGSNLVAGINLSIQALHRLIDENNANDVLTHEPWLVILADGHIDEENPSWQQTVQKLQGEENSSPLTVAVIALTEKANVTALKQLTPHRRLLTFEHDKLDTVYDWLEDRVYDSLDTYYVGRPIRKELTLEESLALWSIIGEPNEKVREQQSPPSKSTHSWREL